jgi:formylglycine-generating enzyme required for sulfatase activity
MANDQDHYLTDYWTTEDNLHFSDFRPALFNILTQAQTPLTVGVFGPWGSGKTSLLRMLKEDVEKKRSPSLRAVWFTAWKYDRHDALWRAFILRVLDALYPRESGDAPWEERERIPVDKLNEKQTKQVEYLDRLSRSLYRPVTWEEKGGWTMAWDEAGKELAKLPAFLLLLAAGNEKVADKLGITPDMAKLLQREVQAQRLDQLASMEQFEATFKDALAEILGPEGRLVVFVDDLDRCLPEKAIEVLEAIKLFLEVPGTAFVLGMDRAVIERGIEARYGECFRREDNERAEFPISGASYLQKIVQIPFHLPPLAVDDVGTYIAALEEKLPGGARLSETTREVFAHGLLPNPRQTKRALNIFRLLKEIAETREMEIAWPLLAKTVLIQTQWPRLYADWRQYPTLVQTLEAEYAHQPFSEKEAIRGRAALPPEGKSEQVSREADEASPGDGGLLAPYLHDRRTYALLERMLAFPASDEEVAEPARFQGLGREQMAAYVRLAGAVGTEEQVVADIATDLWSDMLSGDRALIQDAMARLEAEEPAHDGPQHHTYGERLLQVMRDPAHPAKERASAGDALAQLGDPRFGADAWYLPNEDLLGFVEIPKGPFTMGTRKEDIPGLLERFGGKRDWYEHETPQHTVDLPTYYIARYPVTAAQFRAFVEGSGHEPGDSDSLRGIDDHPVVWISWHEAQAYCDWLTERLRAWKGTPEPLASLLREENWQIMLPSEAQWEKAARGTEPRQFPWGDKQDSERANYDATGIGATNAVGCFPHGASPYEVEELNGNVWEWTRTQWQNDYEDYQPDLGVDDRAVLRGGAFYTDGRFVRCAFRYHVGPHGRGNYFGFRVVCGVPHT